MKKYLAVFSFFLIFQMTFSEIILQVNNTSPSVNEAIRVNVDFINSEKDNYQLEGIENFQIMSKGSQSSYSMINGNITVKKSDTYLLRPLKVGKYKFIAKTNTEKSNEISVDVTGQQISSDKNSIEKFALEDLIPGRIFYFGEKIPFRENFISTVGIDSFDYTKKPDFKEFSVKDITPINNQGNYNQRRVRVNGKEAIEVQLFEGILQANKSGKYILDGGQVAVVESNGTNGFFYNPSPIFLGLKQISIDILPLPEENKPLNFQNVVGKINSEVSWSGESVAYGQAVTLNIKLSGLGNLELLDKLTNGSNSNWTIYETNKNYREDIIEGKYFNEKNYEVAFIPKKSGKISTPEIKISYFNTEEKKYEELVIPSKEIIVTENTSDFSKSKENIDTNISVEQKKPEMTSNEVKKENIEISMLPKEEMPARNVYKLVAAIFISFSVIEFIVIIYMIFKDRKKRT